MAARWKNRPARLLRFGLLLCLVSIVGCEQKSGDATVLSKQHIEARPAKPEPDAQPAQPDRWIVRVEMRHDLRKIDVPVEKKSWDGLKVGDRLQVRYAEGKYTGTIWNSALQ